MEYETDKQDEVEALAAGRMSGPANLPAGFRVVSTQDRDNPRRYVTIMEFPSAEIAAQAFAQNNSDEFLQKLAALCTSGPTYSHLNVTRTIG
jgi:hypothetical protein